MKKTFCSTNHGRLHCWRRNNTRYERQNIFEEARSGHVTCNVWGWISVHGMGDITNIDGRFTAEKYVEILEEVFLPSLRERNYPFPDGRIILVQDRCPVHMARIVQRWFATHPEIEVMDWPSKGCDMNVIENIWANMVVLGKRERKKLVGINGAYSVPMRVI